MYFNLSVNYSVFCCQSSVRTITPLFLCAFFLVGYILCYFINYLYKVPGLLSDPYGWSVGHSYLFRDNLHVIDSVNYFAFPVREHRESFLMSLLSNNKYFILCTEN